MQDDHEDLCTDRHRNSEGSDHEQQFTQFRIMLHSLQQRFHGRFDVARAHKGSGHKSIEFEGGNHEIQDSSDDIKHL